MDGGFGDDVGCIAISALSNNYSPADLAGGVIRCFEAGRDDRAFELVVVMQLRAAFDTLRVRTPPYIRLGR
ncbi:MAG: hypothetical protein JXR15_16125 [Shimia sp.]|uniref:hypothetical protein n=1 Tax=Shimia sp. TaxID=1954381 RepID=UPI003B8C661E